jgi:hypothetical protein
MEEWMVGWMTLIDERQTMSDEQTFNLLVRTLNLKARNSELRTIFFFYLLPFTFSTAACFFILNHVLATKLVVLHFFPSSFFRFTFLV